MTDLQTGISRLSAVQIADGYLYRDDNAQGWYVVDRAAVEAAGRMEPWDYSAWCAEHDADEATREQLIEAGIAISARLATVEDLRQAVMDLRPDLGDVSIDEVRAARGELGLPTRYEHITRDDVRAIGAAVEEVRS
jgi:hypothetical protein